MDDLNPQVLRQALDLLPWLGIGAIALLASRRGGWAGRWLPHRRVIRTLLLFGLCAAVTMPASTGTDSLQYLFVLPLLLRTSRYDEALHEDLAP